MGPVRVTCALGAGVALALALGACSGASGAGTAGTEGPTSLGVELAYADGATPRAEGFARALAASDTPAAPSVAPAPDGTWLRLTVSGPGFAPIVCEFPRRSGGRCDGIPAGSGRVVVVEEWDAAFETLYFRGQRAGVTVHRGQNTAVRVTMRPPVGILFPAADGAVNRRRFDAEIQTEPGAQVHVFLGPWQVGSVTANATGLATLPVDRTRTALAPVADDPAGLPDGEYLLTAVAYPPPGPAGTVRHLGAPHSFAVDLVPPVLQLSAPSVTPALSVDVAGITEPGATVRCGPSVPGDDLQPPVVDGRFTLSGFPVGLGAVEVACDATDRAGNRTLATIAVAHRPDSFALEVTMPDVTNQPTVPLSVQTASNVGAVRVEVASEDGSATLPALLAQGLGDGAFAADVALLRNRWNRVRIVALVGGVEVGATDLAVEHDDVGPGAATAVWISLDYAQARVEGNKIIAPFVQIGYSVAEPVQTIELGEYVSVVPTSYTDGSGILLLSPPDGHILTASAASAVVDLPPGRCYGFVVARVRDRAGNAGPWAAFMVPSLNYFFTCVE